MDTTAGAVLNIRLSRCFAGKNGKKGGFIIVPILSDIKCNDTFRPMKTLAPVLLSLCLSSLAHADASLEFVGAKPQAVYDLLLVQKFPKQIWKKGLKSALGYKVLTGKVRCIANKREALYFCHLEQLDPSTGKVAMIREISGDEHVMKFFDMVFEAKLARGMLVWGEPEALGGAILRTSMMECIFRDPSVYEENKMTPKFAYTGCTLTNRKGDL